MDKNNVIATVEIIVMNKDVNNLIFDLAIDCRLNLKLFFADNNPCFLSLVSLLLLSLEIAESVLFKPSLFVILQICFLTFFDL